MKGKAMENRVILLYDEDCPNVAATRSNLTKALVQAGQDAKWVEMNRTADDTPKRFHGFGSPTVLVDGDDVAGVVPGDGAPCCRTYHDGEGFLRAPSVAMIVSALKRRRPPVATGGGGRKRFVGHALVAAPGSVAALLPSILCPACWPVYAGMLSAVGLGFLMQSRYLFPITAVLLGVALYALLPRRRARSRWGPLVLGLVGIAAIFVGKFIFAFAPATYVGVAGLIGASLWNAWVSRTATVAVCPACEGMDPGATGTAP